MAPKEDTVTNGVKENLGLVAELKDRYPEATLFGFTALSQSINCAKALTLIVAVGSLFYYDNFTTVPVLTTTLHGNYCITWLLKTLIYPDARFLVKVPFAAWLVTFILVSLYAVGPFLAAKNVRADLKPLQVAGVVTLYTLGMFLHFAGDCQKHYTLEFKKGLITEGFYARCRHPNYIGEVFIYAALGFLVQSRVFWCILIFFWTVVFKSNMDQKEKSLARFPEFEEYKKRAGYAYFKLW